MSTRQYDVIIVGGGMVGAALACALADSSLRIAVLNAEPVLSDWPADGFDLRVSAITHGSEQFLKRLQAWPGEHAERVSPFREMHVWDATGQGEIHFDSAELGEAELGHIIENRVLLKTLYRRLGQLPNVEYLAPAIPNGLQIDAQGVRLQLAQGGELQGRLLVGADGARSWVRQQAGIAVRGWDYDQAALVTYVQTSESHRETAWQRFLPDGPLAFLPLSDNASSIVWSTTPSHAQALQAMEADVFCNELGASFAYTLGEVLSCGPRAVFPLRFFETEAYVKPRLALVGDAAHTIHPLAGQGVNLGLADAAALAEVIRDAQQARRDIGEYLLLRRYERWRRADNRGMLIAMDGFKRLFGSELWLLRWLRNTGLNLTDRLPPLKHLIMRQARGPAGPGRVTSDE